MINCYLFASAAYAIGPVPLQWISHIGIISTMVYLGMRDRLPISRGTMLFSAFFIWTAGITLFQVLFSENVLEMPQRATTELPVYLGLRFLTLVAFLAWWQVPLWLIAQGQRERIKSGLILLGVLVSIYALYVYYAQTHGLPEIPRSRVGTGGEMQKTLFTYAFHRALGSFREPSHLAEWLILPLFLSLDQRRKLNWQSVIIGTTMLLTGSLTGIVGMVTGLTMALLLSSLFRPQDFRQILKTVGTLVGSVLIFYVFVAGYESGGVDLVGTLTKRLEPIVMEDGLESSNRDYVYQYLDSKEITLIGEGLGLSNINFSHASGLDLTASFLSLYVNMSLSLGYIGMTLLILFLSTPFLQSVRITSTMISGAYVAWLVVYAVHSEELMAPFGILLAFLTTAEDRDYQDVTS